MKRSMVTFLKGILSVVVALLFFVTVSGCQKEEGTMEKTGKKVDESVDKAKNQWMMPHRKLKKKQSNETPRLKTLCHNAKSI